MPGQKLKQGSNSNFSKLNNTGNIPDNIDVRYLPSYSVPEAALYLRLPKSTLRAWIGRQINFKPLIVPAQEKPLALSFINLIEAYVLASIRREYRLSMNKIRKGLDFISQMYPSDNPLAEKDFETDGLSLFLRETDLVYDISRGSGQIVLEDVVKEYMQRIERGLHGLPIKLYPFSGIGKPDEPRSILIDPKISFGRPILSNTSVPVEIIVERYRAGESMRELAEDYECNQEKIEEAIRCRLWEQAA